MPHAVFLKPHSDSQINEKNMMRPTSGNGLTWSASHEPTSRNRLSSIAANHWRPQSGTANSPDHPGKKILLVGWRQNRAIPQTGETWAACDRVAS
jgi:hypothetical protein